MNEFEIIYPIESAAEQEELLELVRVTTFIQKEQREIAKIERLLEAERHLQLLVKVVDLLLPKIGFVRGRLGSLSSLQHSFYQTFSAQKISYSDELSKLFNRQLTTKLVETVY